MDLLRALAEDNSIEGKIIGIRATVSDYWYNETRLGFSQTKIFNSSLRLNFLGNQPQVFKPGLLFTTQVHT